MLGIWDMPLDTYYGEACVCRLSHLKENRSSQNILVMFEWRHRASDQPLRRRRPACGDRRDSRWLAEEMRIKMFGPGVPGISWETNMNAPEPDNSPTHRAMTGNNIPIVYPLVNIESLTSDRVFL
ncbi:MAG: hypothetical protein CM15mP84_01860 [Cellvibrionales bacterium]|nr:MAG: hypothetical protein CM15mP84_01860 [Cellvibrionales bacterium]